MYKLNELAIKNLNVQISQQFSSTHLVNKDHAMSVVCNKMKPVDWVLKLCNLSFYLAS